MAIASRGFAVIAVSAGALRENSGRFVLAVLGVAFGVALGVSVHLVNASALNEFKLAIQSLSGAADLVIRVPRAGFDESVYPQIARLPQVEAASPAIEGEAQIAGRTDTLTIIGLDPFRASQVQPEFFAATENPVTDLFDPDALLLSHSAAAWLGLKTGDTLRINVGTSGVALKVAGLLSPGAYRQRIAVMDIASAQWRLQRLGRINRLDLRLRPGTDVESFRRQLAAFLPAGAEAVTPGAEAERGASLSRSYRLNLDMLALVALFTGAFLVFSTQVLSVLRRRSQFALLRVLGMTRPALTRTLVAEGALIGILGSTLGVAFGCALAALVLGHFGADLGAGYFQGVSPELHLAPAALAVFWLLGTAFSTVGAALPAIEAGRRAPALAIRAGDEEEGLKKPGTTWAGAGLIVSGLALPRRLQSTDSGIGLCRNCADSARHDTAYAVACDGLFTAAAGMALSAGHAGSCATAGDTAPGRDQHRRHRHELQPDGSHAHYGRILSPVARRVARPNAARRLVRARRARRGNRIFHRGTAGSNCRDTGR